MNQLSMFNVCVFHWFATLLWCSCH